MSQTRRGGTAHHVSGVPSRAVVIRRAVAADLANVRTIVDAAYRPYVARIGKRPAPMDEDYSALNERGDVFVAEEAGAVVGLAVLLDDQDALLLDNVAVAPDCHGRGLGRRLVAFAEDEARRRSKRLVRLYTNEAMVENAALYARLGFVETHRATQNGFRRIFMEKTL